MKLEKLREELESKRKQVVILNVAGYACAGIALVLLITSVLGSGFNRFSGIPFFFLLIGVGVVLLFLGNREKVNYTSYIKKEFAEAVFKELFENVSFHPEDGFSREYLRGLELEYLGDSSKSQDLLTGIYHGVNFKMADLLIEETTTDGDGNSSTSTLFKGQWLEFTFNKDFTSYMQIRPKKLLFKNKKPYKWFTDRPEIELVKLENELFNQSFEVYSSNAHEVYYLLTPHFMEKLLALSKRWDSKIKFGFIDNQFHVVINSGKDLFEVSVWEPLNEEYITQVKSEVEIIQYIIDTLDLTNRIVV